MSTIERLRDWLGDQPEDLRVRNQLAGMELQRGNEAGASEEYAEILRSQPDNVIALNNLAWLTRNADPQKAMEYIRRADELVPENPQITDTYAMVELASGNPRRALELNDSAIQGSPGNPDMRLHRAQILLGADDQEAALLILRDLVAGPEFSGKAEAQDLLDALGGVTP